MSGLVLSATDYVDAGDMSELASGESITVHITITPSGIWADFDRMIDQRIDATNQSFRVDGKADGNVFFQVTNGAGLVRQRTTNTPCLIAGVTVRISCRWKRTTGDMQIWVNGSNAAVTNGTNDNVLAFPNSSAVVSIGYQPGGATNNGVPGRYEQVALYVSADTSSYNSDADMGAYGTGTLPSGLSDTSGQLYIPMTDASHMTDVWGGHTVTRHGGTFFVASTGILVPLEMVPLFSCYSGADTFYLLPVDVTAYLTVILNVWRAPLLGSSPTFALTFQESTDQVNWSTVAGTTASSDPGADTEVQYTGTLTKQWFRLKCVLGGTSPAATWWAIGSFELRRRS